MARRLQPGPRNNFGSYPGVQHVPPTLPARQAMTQSFRHDAVESHAIINSQG
jgi:hypothetical protein